MGETLVNLNYLKHLTHYTEKKENNYTLIVAKKLTRVLSDCFPMEYRQ